MLLTKQSLSTVSAAAPAEMVCGSAKPWGGPAVTLSPLPTVVWPQYTQHRVISCLLKLSVHHTTDQIVYLKLPLVNKMQLPRLPLCLSQESEWYISTQHKSKQPRGKIKDKYNYRNILISYHISAEGRNYPTTYCSATYTHSIERLPSEVKGTNTTVYQCCYCHLQAQDDTTL